MQESIDELEGSIEIHSSMYNLPARDFANFISNLEKESGFYTINIKIGEGDSTREIPFQISPIFTKYAYKIKDTTPVPLINQPISADKNEGAKFFSSRFWSFQKYFFVTNRKYSENETLEVKMKICFIVNKFKIELNEISNELKPATHI